MIKYGLSGCGYFGAEIGRIIAKLPDARLVCCTSPGKTGKLFAQKMHIPHYTDYDSFLHHPDMDAVIIASPNNLHAEQFIKASQAGKNIYIEKPFALSAKDASAMINSANKSGITFMVGHILHFYPRIRQTCALLNKAGPESLGPIIHIHTERTGWEEQKDCVSWKKMKAVSGGHLFHHIHEIDLVQYFAGEASEIFCFADNLAHKEKDSGDEDDVLLLTIRHKNGAYSTMQYGSAFRFSNHFVRINCRNGGIILDFQNNLYTVSINGEVKTEPFFDKDETQSIEIYKQRGGGAGYGSPGQKIPQYLLNVLEKELICFHSALTTKNIPIEFSDLFDGSSAFKSVRTASEAMRSAKTKQPIII